MTVRLEREGPLALVIVDRPRAKNAIDRAAMRRLDSIVEELSGDDALAAVILAGAGDHFISGGDLKDLAELERPEEGRGMSVFMQSVLARWEALRCPTIAAIGGDAYGGGCEIALACDLRVMSRGSRLVFKQVSMGLIPGWGGGQRLSRLIGPSRALLLLVTAAAVGAEQALAIGLADEITEGSALEAARALGARIAAQPRAAVALTKRALVRGAELPKSLAIDLEAELFAQTWGSEDHRRAVRSFLQRSRPRSDD